MPSKKIIKRIKAYKQAYFLSDDEGDWHIDFHSDKDTKNIFKSIKHQSSIPEEQANHQPETNTRSASPVRSEKSQSAGSPRSYSLDRSKLTYKLDSTINNFLRNDPIHPTKGRLRMKCMSMDRYSVKDMSMYYKSNSLTKRIKKIVKNLFFLPERCSAIKI